MVLGRNTGRDHRCQELFELDSCEFITPGGAQHEQRRNRESVLLYGLMGVFQMAGISGWMLRLQNLISQRLLWVVDSWVFSQFTGCTELWLVSNNYLINSSLYSLTGRCFGMKVILDSDWNANFLSLMQTVIAYLRLSKETPRIFGYLNVNIGPRNVYVKYHIDFFCTGSEKCNLMFLGGKRKVIFIEENGYLWQLGV